MRYLAKHINKELLALDMVVKQVFNVPEHLRDFIQSLRDFAQQSTPLNLKPKPTITLMPDIAMIYALTARSQIYLDSMLSEGIVPSFVLVLSPDAASADSILQKCAHFGVQAHIIESSEINASEVFDYIARLKQTYMIYSGFGGGILAPKYFTLGKYFIHIHAGELPAYRGSTTCYYSLLEQGSISASAMFLNAKLDCGDVIAHFGLDTKALRALKNTDIDTTIEPYIRAQSLICALKDFIQNTRFTPQKQDFTQGETYYRIHPVLKHLAMFVCFGQCNTQRSAT